MKLLGRHLPGRGALDILKYIGPGFLVTVGFIDPGNWAANVAAGAGWGAALLWVVTLSTVMLLILQHNAAHLGIASGLCLSEAATKHLPLWTSRSLLFTAMVAAAATALAEILGAAIGLNMLLGLPLPIGSLLTAGFTALMLFSNGYRGLERWIIGFVSLIGLAFIAELCLVHVDWHAALRGCVVPAIPPRSLPIVMSVLGAVVMPSNIFLHSEIIQSRQWNLEDDQVIRRQLKYGFYDTLSAMAAGWVINCAMILVAAAAFFSKGIAVTELQQAHATLKPLAGGGAAFIFALALVLAGLASSITAALAGASIFAGIYGEPYDMKASRSRMGAGLTIAGGVVGVLLLRDPFQGLIWSQVALSIQLPFTVFALIALTSSREVMGRCANPASHKVSLWAIAAVVAGLNILLLADLLKG